MSKRRKLADGGASSLSKVREEKARKINGHPVKHSSIIKGNASNQHFFECVESPFISAQHKSFSSLPEFSLNGESPPPKSAASSSSSSSSSSASVSSSAAAASRSVFGDAFAVPVSSGSRPSSFSSASKRNSLKIKVSLDAQDVALQARCDFLKDVPLLKSLSQDQLKTLSRRLEEHQWKNGEHVYRAGEPCTSFYIIRSGVCVIGSYGGSSSSSSSSDPFVARATLGERDYFGEAALMSDEKAGHRSDAIAQGDLTAYLLDKEQFRLFFESANLVNRFPRRQYAVSAEKDSFAARSAHEGMRRSAESAFSEDTEGEAPDDATAEFLLCAVENNAMFRDLDLNHRRDVCKAMRAHPLTAGEVLFRRTELGRHFYVVTKGKLHVVPDAELDAVERKGSSLLAAPQRRNSSLAAWRRLSDPPSSASSSSSSSSSSSASKLPSPSSNKLKTSITIDDQGNIVFVRGGSAAASASSSSSSSSIMETPPAVAVPNNNNDASNWSADTGNLPVYGIGSCFGDLALLYTVERSESVRAETDCVLWSLDRFSFHRIAKDIGSAKLERYVQALRLVDVLTPLAEYERVKIAKALDEVTIQARGLIFELNDDANALYIVEEGEVELIDAEGQVTDTCTAGSYFGDKFLQNVAKRTMTARASSAGAAKLFCLTRADVKQLLGPIEHLMKHGNKRKLPSSSASSPSSQTDALLPKPAAVSSPRLGGIANSASPHLKSINSPRRAALQRGTPPPSLNLLASASAKVVPDSPNFRALQDNMEFTDFQYVGVLGRGTFGVVLCVRHTPTNMLYALKCIKRSNISEGHIGHIQSEKLTMERFNKSPFLSRLYRSFKGSKYLYFVLQLSLGGDLFTMFERQVVMEESTVRFYAACVLLALESMHLQNVIYRDLKLENILLTEDGYVRLADFGFAKKLKHKSARTWTLCGTPCYLSPELVKGKGHGKGVDWWALGVLIYVMLSRAFPFDGDTELQIYDQIVYDEPQFPSYFSADLKSLLTQLLEKNPTRRLGVLKGGANLVKRHPWFRGFNFRALYSKSLKAPLLPKIGHETDLSNFDTSAMNFDDFGEYEGGNAACANDDNGDYALNGGPGRGDFDLASPLQETDVLVWPKKNKDI